MAGCLSWFGAAGPSLISRVDKSKLTVVSLNKSYLINFMLAVR